ncbi:hypothetical protein IC575_028501 [Cucumis melo]
MGNSSTSKVERQGKVILKMTFSKELTLNNVLHVPNLHKNLVSGSLLSKNGFKFVFVFDKFVLSKNEMYIRKSYLSDSLFKLNVLTIVSKSIINNKVYTFTYVVESFVWHVRLEHVNFNSLRMLINMNLIPNSLSTQIIDVRCVESKMTKAPFHSSERITKPLELIHSDICNLKFM